MAQNNVHQKPIVRRTYTNPVQDVAQNSRCSQHADDKQPKKPTGYMGSFSESDRYFSASSDEEYDDDDDDYDDDEICIRLDSDDDDQSLSGFHINLKTLQAVSTMLAQYSPIIQSDIFGNPTFVPPPPPPDEEYFEEARSRSCRKQPPSSRKPSNRIVSDYSYSSAMVEDDDYQYAIQELEDVLLNQDNPTLTDAMTELSDVMEKMTRFTEEMNQESN